MLTLSNYVELYESQLLNDRLVRSLNAHTWSPELHQTLQIHNTALYCVYRNQINEFHILYLVICYFSSNNNRGDNPNVCTQQ